ncbi:uncharacterized protein LOC131874091 [Cryptomeria japonica]|uniref:uncharacterized protein LOC131874091 n=1 Tax=Cryptomeria japonica TaxID=3369 RepID=UPI0027DA608F|nr:uncharacterized protein LOC131874091 [Cryptomeria japonica]
MPFGLINAGAMFQRVMDLSFGNLSDKIIVVYLYDLTIFSKKRKHHVRDLRKEGVKVDPQRVEAIQQLSLPSNRNGVRSFFGQVNFLRHFIPDFAETTKYIINIMSEKVDFKWNEEEHTVSRILVQKSEDNEEVPISFMYYILHSHSTVFVPKYVVKSLLTQQDVGINNRASWFSKIQEFNLDIKPTKLVRGKGLCKLMVENKFEEEGTLPLTLFVSHQGSWFTDVAYYLTYGDCPSHLSPREKQNLKLKATNQECSEMHMHGWKSVRNANCSKELPIPSSEGNQFKKQKWKEEDCKQSYFQPPATHLILDLDAEEVQCDMATPMLDADKVLADSNTTTQDSHVLDIRSNAVNATQPPSGDMQSKELTLAPK